MWFQFVNDILVWSLILLISIQAILVIRSKKMCRLWSPITFISLVYIYYCIIPYFSDNQNVYGVSIESAKLYFNVGALLSYRCLLLGYRVKTKTNFSTWNNLITLDNCRLYGVLLFVIGFLCYIPFRGFHMSIFNVSENVAFNRDGFTSYFIELISLFCAGSCLILANKKKRIDILFLVSIWISLVFYIIAGFRFRILLLFISLFTTYHLFPKQRRVNYPVVIGLVMVLYIGFSIMENARSYGHGIDIERALEFRNQKEFKRASENCYVYSMSALSMERMDKDNQFLYFEPIITALCMPLPRFLAPWKPDGSYLKDLQVKIFGTSDYGAAFLFFTEAFISWWWFGVILYSLFVGWFSKKLWDNYLNNPNSIGAIVLLGLYNAFCYVLISRGYMAQALNTFIYYVIMPFWLCQLFKKFSK